jgi:DNA-binding Xre family transcriptional regulator
MIGDSHGSNPDFQPQKPSLRRAADEGFSDAKWGGPSRHGGVTDRPEAIMPDIHMPTSPTIAGADTEETTTEPPGSGPVAAPTPEEIAGVVRVHRRLRGWKVSVLAEMAGVSVSTIERVERGEAVTTDTLDSIAQALGFQAGDFWRPRQMRTPEEALTWTLRFFDRQMIVPCRVFASVSDAKAAIAAVATYVVVQGPGQPDARTEELVAVLRETLGLMSFATSDILEPKLRIRPRQAQRDVLAAVEAVARRGYTPLLATYEAATPWGRGPIAAISFHPRLTDPGAPKRRELIVPAAISAGEIDWETG